MLSGVWQALSERKENGRGDQQRFTSAGYGIRGWKSPLKPQKFEATAVPSSSRSVAGNPSAVPILDPCVELVFVPERFQDLL